MSNKALPFLVGILLLGCATAKPVTGPEATSGFSALLDPALSAWKGDPVHWRMEGDVLAHDGQGNNLITRVDYGDFELLADWKIEKEGDSGIYLRGTPQIQIWDPDQKNGEKLRAPKGSGGLWNNNRHANDPLVRADKPIGEWNHFRIKMVGERVWVWLNDQLVVDRTPLESYHDKSRPVPVRGPIELQTHHHPIWFRNVQIRPIAHEEAVTLLTAGDETGFSSVWNGKDFSGWKGPVDNYQIADGAIQCQEKKGGTIFTEAEYGDFIARVEFKVPPGGNNGLAIRYPGEGDPAYSGMTELQVLDSEHPKYSKLDARQFHGSAYGMAAAQRGYLQSTGDWNFEEVTIKGSTIKVELNGTVILETDLANATGFLDGKEHPGRDRSRGHFGFAGHNDPVSFRRISIKALE